MFIKFGNIKPVHDLSVTAETQKLHTWRRTEIHEGVGTFDIYFSSRVMMACQKMYTSVAVL
jgi:hypothetical protein